MEPNFACDYDQLCKDAVGKAEQRLIDHINRKDGENFSLEAECLGCGINRQFQPMKTCLKCKTALFCNEVCMEKASISHKNVCDCIALFHQVSENNESLFMLLQQLGWNEELQNPTNISTNIAKTLGISLDINGKLPGWVKSTCLLNMNEEENEKFLQLVTKLYAILRNSETWTTDSQSFPQSSYTFSMELQQPLKSREKYMKELLDCHGALFLFTCWFQNPQPPAILASPLESRGIFGILDSILQISEIKGDIDQFMNDLHH